MEEDKMDGVVDDRIHIRIQSTGPLICSLPSCRQPVDAARGFFMLTDNQGTSVTIHAACIGLGDIQIRGKSANGILAAVKWSLRAAN